MGGSAVTNGWIETAAPSRFSISAPIAWRSFYAIRFAPSLAPRAPGSVGSLIHRLRRHHLRLSAPSAFRFQVSVLRSSVFQRLFHPPPSGCPIGRSSHKLRSQRLLMWAGRPRPAMIASRLPQPSGFRSPSSGLTIIQVSALRSYLPTQVSGLKFPLSDSPPFLSSHHSALASSGFKSQPSGLQYFSSQISGLSTPVSPPLRAMLDRSPVQFRFGCLFFKRRDGAKLGRRAGRDPEGQL